jgi:hypothetical protein
MLFGAQTGAAGELANIGRTEAGIGLGETGQGLTAENIGREAEQGAAGLNLQSRELSNVLHQQSVNQLSSAFEDLLSGAAPGGWMRTIGKKLFGSGNKAGGDVGSDIYYG